MYIRCLTVSLRMSSKLTSLIFEYMVESLVLLTWLFSHTLCYSGFCLQVRNIFVANVLVK